MEMVDNGAITALVDYAHTDDALRNVLETARPLTKGGYGQYLLRLLKEHTFGN